MKAIHMDCHGAITEIDVDRDRLAEAIGAEYFDLPRAIPGCRLVVDDSGLINNKSTNPTASTLYGYQIHGWPIAGDALLVGEQWIDGEPDVGPPPDNALEQIRTRLAEERVIFR